MKTRILALFLILSIPVIAGETRYWQVQKRSAFAVGMEFKNLELTARGELRLGFVSKGIEVPDEPSMWTGAEFEGTTYLGTGTGKIYRIVGGKVEKDFETGEMLVTCFAKWNGLLYAATIPNGKIFRRSDGKWSEFCKLKAKYVWAMLVSDDGLLAATGNKGQIFAVDSEGKSKVWYKTKVENILCLAKQGDGVLVGTAGPGRLIRVTGGRGVVLYDYGKNEVKSISLSGGDIYTAVNTGTDKAPSDFLGAVAKKKPVEPKKPEDKKKKEDDEEEKEEESTSGNSTIWKLSSSRTYRIAEFESAYITEIVSTKEGLYVGTDRSGRVFRVHDDGSYDLVHDFKEKQVLAFLVRDGQVSAALMGNRAAVRRFSKKRAKKGVYVSKVFDSKYPSHWGNIEWRGRGEIKIQTRTGNVSNPKEGWTKWSESVGGNPGKVKSPKGRYFQFRITLEDASARVRGVTLAYKNENQQPRVTGLKIQIVPPSASYGSRGPSPRLGQGHAVQKKISWRGKDDDSDYLVYRIYYKPVEGGTWIPILGDGTQPKPTYTWNTENVPDGKYFIKVTASDEQANPDGEHLMGQDISVAFQVDNTKPTVKIESILGGKVKATATDKASHIFRLEYRVDGGAWHSVVCKDGIFDARTEQFEFPLNGVKPGRHTLTVRVLDRESNVGTTSKTFEVSK